MLLKCAPKIKILSMAYGHHFSKNPISEKKNFSKLKSLGVLKHILMYLNKTRSYNKYLF